MALKVEEANILIAEFMGFQYGDTYAGKRWRSNKHGYPYATIALAFNSKWDWLMPVVEKIESLGAVEIIIGAHAIIVTVDEGAALHREYKFGKRPKIDAVFEAIVSFIKWYQALTPAKN